MVISSCREFISSAKQIPEFVEKKWRKTSQRKGFGRGGEFSSFLEELGTQLRFQKNRLCFSLFFGPPEVPKGSTLCSNLDFPGNPTVKYYWFPIGNVTKSPLERQGTAFGDLWRAEKSRKTQTVFFFESEAEYLIPQKMKRTRHHRRTPFSQTIFSEKNE